MLVFAAAIGVGMTADQPAVTATALTCLAAVVAALWVILMRRPAPAQPDHDVSRPLDALLTPGDLTERIPVAHEGATEGWSPAEALTDVGDPFTRPLSEIELREALLFDEIAGLHPVRLDWAPVTFTQGWELAGQRLAEMGDTQALPRIEVAAA